MPECQSCGSHVTARYVKVMCPGDEAEACPRCTPIPDLGGGRRV